MKLIVILAVSVAAFFMPSHLHATTTTDATYNYFGLIIASCRTREAIEAIAKADETLGPEHTLTVFKRLSVERLCGRHVPPIIVKLSERLRTYEDTEGNKTEIWKVFGMEYFTLVASDKLMLVPKEKKKEELAI